MTWVAAAIGGSALLGAGASIYGANKQAKAIASANAANQASEAEAARQNWVNYLMQRGVMPSSSTQTGEVPTNLQVVNTKLPIWATMRNGSGGIRRIVRGPVQQRLVTATNTQRVLT